MFASKLQPLRIFSKLNNNKKSIFEFQKKRDYHEERPIILSTGCKPFLSKEALAIHYDYHSKNINKLNNDEKGKLCETFQDLVKLSREILEDQSEAPLMNNLSNVINHAFFFDGLNHPRTMEKTRVVLPANVEERFTEEFDGIDRFYDKFGDHAKATSSSAWVWLVDREGSLDIMCTYYYSTPWALGEGITPILCLDMWEHSYLLEYSIDRDDYVSNFWRAVDWEVVSKRLDVADKLATAYLQKHPQGPQRQMHNLGNIVGPIE